MIKKNDKPAERKKKNKAPQSGIASQPAVVHADTAGKGRRLKISTVPADKLKKAYRKLQAEVAERKKAEELAKAERQRFFDVLEMLPAYVVLLSPDYHVPFANRFFRERFGESRGRRCYEYLFHRVEPCDNCESFKVLKTGKPHHWEWTGPDGRNYDIYDYLFTDSSGSNYIMEMGIDVTERKQAEKVLNESNLTLEKRVHDRTRELKLSEEKYRNLFSTMTEGFGLHEIITDARGNPCDYRFLDVNAAFEKLTGISPEKVIGRTIREVMPDIDPDWIQKYGRVALTGEPAHFEQFASPLNRWYDCYTYSPSRGQFVVLFTDITGRRTAEIELAHLASFPEMSPNPIIELDASGDIKYINPVAGKLFPDLPLLGKRHALLTNWKSLVRELRQTEGQVFKREIEVGNDWYEEAMFYIPSTRLFRIYARDITNRKQAEDSLRGAYELLEAVTRGTEVIIASIDTDYRYTYSNTAYQEEIRRLTGRDIRIGMSLLDVFIDIPEQMKIVKEEWSQPLRGETTSKTLDFGEPQRYSRTYRVYHTPVRDADGNIIGAGEVAFDISQQVQDQKTLRETRDYLDNLFNYANAPIIVWDPQFRITRFNHAFERLTGLKSTEVLGKKVDVLIPARERKEALKNIQRATTIGEHWEVVEIPIQHVDGSVHIVLWNSATLFAEDGKTPIATIAQGQEITEMKQAQKELLESQRDLNRAQAVAHTGSWRLDIRRDELLWSDETYRIFKIPAGTPMTYETFLASVYPDDREYVNEHWQAALQGEEYDLEHRILVDNEIRWVHEKAEIDFDNQGMVRGGFGTIQDITEKKLAEERIKQIADEWQSTFDSIADLVSIQDNDFRLVRVNHAYEQATGKKQGELVGKMCYEAIHGTICPADSCPHVETVKFGKACTREIFEPRLGIYLEVTTSPILDKTGKTTGTIHIAKDITARKKADEKITLQARMLDAIMDSIVAFDIEGRIIYWGRGASLLLGWRPEEVIGRRMFDVFIPQDPGRLKEAIANFIDSGNGWSGDLPVNRLDGTLAPLLVQFSPIKDDGNRVIGAIAVGKDITELKKIDHLKDEFIGLVSHELRTPLTIINGAVRTAMDERITDEERNMLLEDAASGVEGLSNILDNLLELSRYQAARLRLDKKTVDIREIAEATARKVHQQYPLRTLRMNIFDGLPPVLVDPVRLERIIYNLVDNAFKYSGDTDEVLVFARQDKDRVIVGVTDHGPGIPVEDQADLFEPFVRLGDTIRKGGIGLGLVVCKRLVEAHGGQIWLESAPGKGSTFFFSVPVVG